MGFRFLVFLVALGFLDMLKRIVVSLKIVALQSSCVVGDIEIQHARLTWKAPVQNVGHSRLELSPLMLMSMAFTAFFRSLEFIKV